MALELLTAGIISFLVAIVVGLLIALSQDSLNLRRRWRIGRARGYRLLSVDKKEFPRKKHGGSLPRNAVVWGIELPDCASEGTAPIIRSIMLWGRNESFNTQGPAIRFAYTSDDGAYVFQLLPAINGQEISRFLITIDTGQNGSTKGEITSIDTNFRFEDTPA